MALLKKSSVTVLDNHDNDTNLKSCLYISLPVCFGILLLFVIPVLSYAQTTTTPQSQLDFAKIVADQYSTNGTPDIDVLYQNPHLLILRASLDHFKSLGPILDLATNNGYNVTTATVFTIRSAGATPESPGVLTDMYTIFMSKK